MQSAALLDSNRLQPRLLRTFGWAWVAFWALMLLIGVQEYLWGGGRRLWEPVLDYATAASMATLVCSVDLLRSRRHDKWLGQPAQWFVRMLAWLPLVALGYVAGMYALRHAVRALAGFPYKHGPWSEVFLYESAKFTIFYVLFTAVSFGLRSYSAWNVERLRTEEQARLAREAQLALLTQQLQPHFLFNALNTVSALIHTDPDLADTLLTRLATLLRAATDAGRRSAQPLAEELALLQAYAQIMTQRFADRAGIEWRIDPAALSCLVPTLGLQPLLENCFVHVVERRRAPTHIVVRANCRDERLRIEVENDGDASGQASAHGVGLDNLAERLKALHGDRAALTLLPRPEGGLTVRVELPCEH